MERKIGHTVKNVRRIINDSYSRPIKEEFVAVPAASAVRNPGKIGMGLAIGAAGQSSKRGWSKPSEAVDDLALHCSQRVV